MPQTSDTDLSGAENFLSGTQVVPSMDFLSCDFSLETFERVYKVFQLVHLRNACDQTKMGKNVLSWQGIASIFEHLNEKDKETWCIETASDAEKSISPKIFLQSLGSTKTRAYCSFLIQNDKQVLEDTLMRLPVQTLEFVSNIKHETALWIFFGRNPPTDLSAVGDLDGRPEHTDSVSHDGTWHYQLSGEKIWALRPSAEMKKHLRRHFSGDSDGDLCMNLRVKKGDMLVINTRLWIHRTMIPLQKHPSVSYARDFYFSAESANLPRSEVNMMNLDGLYAVMDIDADTIIFRESEMPSCALHRASADACNCRVVELDDGTCAVVSIRCIKAGEFFCVPETDDETHGSDTESDINSEGSL